MSPGARAPRSFEVGSKRLGDLAQRHRGAGRGALARHFAVDDLERIDGLLQQLGRHLDRLLADIDRREPGRLAGHHGHAGRERAHPEGDPIGAAVHDPHPPIVGAKRIRADLRHHRLDALTERGRARDHLDETRGVDRHPHAVERPEPALLDENGEPGPDVFAARAALR